MKEEISQEEVQGTWRRCLIQFVALDYALWYDEIAPKLTQPPKHDGGVWTSSEETSPYLYLRDMLFFPLLYPRVLCELKRVVDLSEKIETLKKMRYLPEIESLLKRVVSLSQKIETLTEVRPPPQIVNLFSEIIRGFGSEDGETAVSEEEESLRKLFDPQLWEDPAKVRSSFENIKGAAKLTRLVNALKEIPGLFNSNESVDIGTRDRILYDWAKLNDPMIWGAHIEVVSSLGSQLPIAEATFSAAKPHPSQEKFFQEALRVMTDFLKRAIELRKKDLESLLEDPTSLRLRDAFGVTSCLKIEETKVTTENLAEQLGFLETVLWVVSDEPYLSTLFERVQSRLPKANTLVVNKGQIIASALFPGSLALAKETIGKLGWSLKTFKQQRDSLVRLGVKKISEFAGGYSI